jgi:uncharacterized membrane protein required for colicin V production
MRPEKQNSNDGDSRRGGKNAILSRVLMGLLVFAVVTALSRLLPVSMPGELSLGQMTRHAAEPCQACPTTEQIVAVGIKPGEDKWFLNVRFAAPPFNTTMHTWFAGVPGAMEVQQTGKAWRIPRAKHAGMLAVASVTQRDNQVVFGFPAALRISGVAVGTGSGDRLPASGFAEPVFSPASHFNATDVVLLLIFVASAWYVFKRGLAVELADLIVVMASVAVSVMVRRPLAGALAQMTTSPQTAALAAGGLAVVVLGTAGFFWVTALRRFVQGGAQAIDFRLNGVCGSTAAALRQCVMLAMLLTAGADLAVLGWASASIHSSIIGETLVHAWKGLFT